MPEHAVVLDGVGYTYQDQPALQNLSVTVPVGSLFALLGPNGGGKTTLFRILSTLIAPDQGNAYVAGYHTVKDAAKVRQHLGVVFQQPALDEELTVAENLEVHGALYQLPRREVQHRAEDLLVAFDLKQRRKDPVKSLSGGLKRRVDLIRGLLNTPAVLLLDEPTTGLDPLARSAYWEQIHLLRRKSATTLVVATHLLEEAHDADYVLILDQGCAVAQGTPSALIKALGDETLWLESDDAGDLAFRIQQEHALNPQVIGSRIQISHPQAHALLPVLYAAFAEQIRAATVRKPTLEDVFLIHTGRDLSTEPPIASTPSP